MRYGQEQGAQEGSDGSDSNGGVPVIKKDLNHLEEPVGVRDCSVERTGHGTNFGAIGEETEVRNKAVQKEKTQAIPGSKIAGKAQKPIKVYLH